MHGSFALGIIFKDEQDLIVGARRGSPLAVGYGPNENYLGSDSYALKSMTNKVTYLDDGEFCIVKKDQVLFFNEEGKKINKKILELTSNDASYDKGEFKHFMAKEIEEQPNTIKTGIKEYIDNLNKDINIFNFPWKKDEIKQFLKRLKQLGANGQWGIFAMGVSGRVGYQCSNFYRKLVEKGDIKDPNYVLGKDGKYRFLQKSTSRKQNLSKDHINISHNHHNIQLY